MQEYNPGPDGNANDNDNTDPRGVDAPQHRLGEDVRQINGQD